MFSRMRKMHILRKVIEVKKLKQRLSAQICMAMNYLISANAYFSHSEASRFISIAFSLP